MSGMGDVSRGRLDEESQAMLYEGANVTQLAAIFGCAIAVINRKIYGLRPSAVRNGSPVYLIREVAKRVWRPTDDEVRRAVMTLHHNDLPKLLSKEFWAGLRSRQEYEIRAGDLWPTAKVIEKVGELMKLVKMSAQLMSDAVERTGELTDAQRAKIKQLTRAMLIDLHAAVVEHFLTPDVLPGIEQPAQELGVDIGAWSDDDAGEAEGTL